MSASVDFLGDFENPRTLAFHLAKVLHVEDEPGPDLAFLQIEQLAGGPQLASPILLAAKAPTITPAVAVIGYPASDSRIPDYDLMIKTFGNVFDMKRLAPGAVTQVRENQILHDCSTLGGNSGSVVLDLERGEAVGLHFSGRFLEANYAVRADVVRHRLDDLLEGRIRGPRNGGRKALHDATPPLRQKGPPPSGSMSFSIPLVVTVSLEAPVRRVGPPPPPRAESDDEDVDISEAKTTEDYAEREGYLADFLGTQKAIELPTIVRNTRDVLTFELAGCVETVLRYQHFSVVMSTSRRMCIYSAVNIDGEKSRKTTRATWRWDPRIPRERQIMKECYGNPPKFSRGHMTRREDPAWGSPRDAALGNEDSMHVTNTTPQMQAFNSPIWLGLEDYALQHARSDEMKISVFTGPFFSKNDPEMWGVRVPRTFWKIIAFIHDRTGELCATGYSMEQDAELPEREFVFGQYTSPQLAKTTQVPIHWIESRSGLRFDGVANFDPLAGDEEGVDDGGAVKRTWPWLNLRGIVQAKQDSDWAWVDRNNATQGLFAWLYIGAWNRIERIAIYRKRINHEPVKGKQLDLFNPDDGYWEYSVVATNKTLDLRALWHFQHGRGVQEKIIGELKSGLAFASIPSQAYSANTAWQKLNVLTHNIATTFQLQTLAPHKPRSLKRTTAFLLRSVATLRFEWLNKAARLVRPHGTPVLRLADNRAVRQTVTTIEKALQAA